MPLALQRAATRQDESEEHALCQLKTRNEGKGSKFISHGHRRKRAIGKEPARSLSVSKSAKVM
jgi:hypothetical protein